MLLLLFIITNITQLEIQKFIFLGGKWSLDGVIQSFNIPPLGVAISQCFYFVNKILKRKPKSNRDAVSCCETIWYLIGFKTISVSLWLMCWHAMYCLLGRRMPTVLLQMVAKSASSSNNQMSSLLAQYQSYETLLVTSPNENVYHVQLNRPKQLNAMNQAFWRFLLLLHCFRFHHFCVYRTFIEFPATFESACGFIRDRVCLWEWT